MAKKKKTIKSSTKTLRQALLSVKTAIIHFSEDHIVSIWYNPSSKETVVTDIPQNLSSQFTLGEGGGSSFSNPKLTINAVTELLGGYITQSYSAIEIVDDELVLGIEHTVDGQETIEYYIPHVYYDGMDDYAVDFFCTDGTTSIEYSDFVNCTVENNVIYVTDPTQDASVTATIVNG